MRAWRIPISWPDRAILAREIVESQETVLEQFKGIEDLLEEGK